jgi:hypothetical protein
MLTFILIKQKEIKYKSNMSHHLEQNSSHDQPLNNTKANDILSWNEKIENNVKEIGEKSKGYKIMHIKQSRKIARTYKYLTYTGILLGPLAGLLSGIGAILSPSDDPVGFPIAATCVGFISGIVVVIIKTGKYEESNANHKLAASKYTSLESNVRRQLDLCRTNRANASKYLEWVGSSFDELFMGSPLVAEKIYNEYVKLAKNHNIVIPDEYGLTIDVNKSYQNNKLTELTNVSLININKKNNLDVHDTTVNIDVKIDIPDNPKDEQESLSDNMKVKRNDRLSTFPELNKYSDSRMEYEMKRMIG